jgi:hypothetical protein
MKPLETPGRKSVRQEGLRRFAIGAAVFAIGITIPVFLLPYLGHQLTPPGMIPFALPGAYALSGLIEAVTGISFIEAARRWDELQGWQRGVFGTFIVLVAGILIICGFALFASYL